MDGNKVNLSQEYEIKAEKLSHLLNAFYLSTGTPIALYFGKSDPFITTEGIKQCLSEEQNVIFQLFRQCQRNNCDDILYKDSLTQHYAAKPLMNNLTILGYLLVVFPIESKECKKEEAVCYLLHLLAEHIIAQKYISLLYQKHVNDFHQIVWDYPQYDWDVPFISEILHTSKTTLYKYFKRYTGQTIAQYIQSIRLEKAQYLLLHSNLSVTEISSEVGFNDYNYFLRVFKKKFQVSANAYRRCHL